MLASLRPSRWVWVGMLLGGTSVLFLQLAVLAPTGVSRALARFYAHDGRWIGWVLSRLSAVAPTSLAECLLVAAVVLLLWRINRLFRRLRHESGHRQQLAINALWWSMGAAGWVAFLFYAAWGFQYAAPPLEQRLSMTLADDAIDDDLVARLAEEMIAASNREYATIHGDAAVQAPPTTLPPLDEIEAAVERSWRIMAASLGLGSPTARPYGRAKPALLSPLMSHLGLSGFYFPFTGEANINRNLPPTTLPRTFAHEKAHQRGFAPENEANFLSFLVGAYSDHPHVRYSCALFAQNQLLTVLYRTDRDRTLTLMDARLPGVQGDLDRQRAFWDRHRGPARRMSRRMNNAYLNSNRVAGGVQSYSRSVELMLRWGIARGGTLLPEGLREEVPEGQPDEQPEGQLQGQPETN